MTATVSRLPFLPSFPDGVPQVELPGVLLRLTGPDHQPVRAEALAALVPGAEPVELVRCRCGRLFTAEAMTAHLIPATASADAPAPDRPTGRTA